MVLLLERLLQLKCLSFRYTDLLNTDKDVRLLLTNFLLNVRKVYRSPNTSEYRVLWLVNTLK